MLARLVVGISAVALLLLGGTAAAALPGGTLIILDKPADPSSPTFEKEIRKSARKDLAKNGETWRLYFVAYLKKPAGAEEVNLVFYETPDGSKKGEQVNHFAIQTKASAKILMSDIEISPEQGFKPGKRYLVLITRLVGGREDVYASAKLELR